MPQPYDAIDYAAAALALVDNLMTRLRTNGVLIEPDARQIVADSIAGLETSPDRNVQNAADLLRLIYHKP
jgi:protein-L-isoaspartate O-methyltransferase